MAGTIPIYNVLFPTTIAVTAVGKSARFLNRRFAGDGGDLSIVGIWERHVGMWSIESMPYEALETASITPTDIEKAIAMFWWSRGGKGFWFRPPAGFVVGAGQGFISGGKYYRRYTAAAGLTYDREVKPDPDLLVTVGSTWTGQLWVPAMFAMDELEEEYDGEGNHATLPAIEIIEVPNYSVVA